MIWINSNMTRWDQMGDLDPSCLCRVYAWYRSIKARWYDFDQPNIIPLSCPMPGTYISIQFRSVCMHWAVPYSCWYYSVHILSMRQCIAYVTSVLCDLVRPCSDMNICLNRYNYKNGRDLTLGHNNKMHMWVFIRIYATDFGPVD